ncbi:MAG TPA: acetate/propionate family kinase [Burkholderiales bacterium]|nr:acetate/propionate family kinase [Burkholderiales bacterium]
MSNLILVLNAGSSSVKFQLFELGEPQLLMRLRGQIDGIGTRPHFAVRDHAGSTIADMQLDVAQARDQRGCLDYLAHWLSGAMNGELVALGHRVVHGGAHYASPIRITDDVLRALDALVPLAPLHQPFNLTPIRAFLDRRPDLPQVACFDTAFHRSQPLVAELFALPISFYESGVRRYGFHGLSYEYIARQLRVAAPDIADERVVVAHLGSGASLCAVHGGRSVATTMGFTALDGLPMGTRCGALDPGVVLYLARERGMSIDAIESLLYKNSGLLGLSQESNDMRVLLDSDSQRARLAVDYFVYRIVREVAALAGAMSGIDAIVFTAGIGENSAEIRGRILSGLTWLGVDVDEQANHRGETRITRAESKVSAWTIATNEELMIALHTRELLALGAETR